MSDFEELKRIAKAAVGVSDVSLAPDVIIELIDERAQLRQMTAGQEQVIKTSHKTTTDQRQAIQRLQVQVSKMEEMERELAYARTTAEELALNNKRLAFDLDLLRKDADRYRWLRAQTWDASAIAVIVNPKESAKLGSYCPSGSLLDQAIDASI